MDAEKLDALIEAHRMSARATCPARKLLMTFEVTPTSHTLADYRARGGYAGDREGAAHDEAQAGHRRRSPPRASRAAAAPTSRPGRKWAVINLNDGQPHYLCANADEGEPGTFKDRWILENAPHLLLESMLIAAYALQVRHAFIYIRGEFDLPYRRLAGALDEAYAAGYFGKPLFGTDFACDLIVYRGAGSYVCGEASGLLTSLEGKRGYPRNRPPRLTVRGLYQRPTVVNNVETLSNIAGIIDNGADGLQGDRHDEEPGHAAGLDLRPHQRSPASTKSSPATRAASSSSTTCGGVPGGRKVKAIIPGGISTKVADRRGGRAAHARQRGPRHRRARRMGSGGMIVIAEGTCMVRLLQVLLRFYHHESCGQCTPCREGMGWMHRIIDRIVAGEGRARGHRAAEADLAHGTTATTICGMGDAAGYATLGILAKFGDEFEHYIDAQALALRREPRMPRIFIDGQPDRGRRAARP